MSDPLAVEVVGSFMKQAPVDVFALAQALGLIVDIQPLPEKISGKIEGSSNGPCKVTINGAHGERRQRFTLAHEIAHFILHRDLIGDGIEDNGLYRSNQPSHIEWQANQYAADILMPWRLVREAYHRKGVETPTALADMFAVSPDVAKIRLEELALI